MMQGGGVFINKVKVEDVERALTKADLLKGKYILAQKGKKNYFLVKIV
jgi:tyrosyl-tRNA synthetase